MDSDESGSSKRNKREAIENERGMAKRGGGVGLRGRKIVTPSAEEVVTVSVLSPVM
jgi:hypothetical protein